MMHFDDKYYYNLNKREQMCYSQNENEKILSTRLPQKKIQITPLTY